MGTSWPPPPINIIINYIIINYINILDKTVAYLGKKSVHSKSVPECQGHVILRPVCVCLAYSCKNLSTGRNIPFLQLNLDKTEENYSNSKEICFSAFLYHQCTNILVGLSIASNCLQNLYEINIV